MPASGITISLGKGMQQLSIAIASTMPRYPKVTYQFLIRSVIVCVILAAIRCSITVYLRPPRGRILRRKKKECVTANALQVIHATVTVNGTRSSTNKSHQGE